MSLVFDWITTDQGLDDLRDEWLLLDDGPGTVFRSWEWQATWWHTLGKAPGRELRILRARDGQETRAILPLYVERAPVAGFVPRRRLRFLADGVVGSDYLGLIGPAELAPAMARELAQDASLREIGLFQLTDMPSDDPFVAALTTALSEAGFGHPAARPRYVCPYAQIDDFAAYLKSRADGFGRQMATKAKQLARLPDYRLEILDRPDDAALDALFDLHRARWAEEGGSQGFTGPDVETFHRRVVPLLAARGWVRLGIVYAEGLALAAGYAFVRGKSFDWYQSGMLPEWRKRSPGMVLMIEMMRRAVEAGATEVDFLHGEEPYKGIWATHTRTTSSIHAVRGVFSARTAARADDLYAKVRAIAHDRLPPNAVSALRKIFGRASIGGGSR